jgi:hypothetical protein
VKYPSLKCPGFNNPPAFFFFYVAGLVVFRTYVQGKSIREQRFGAKINPYFID